MTYCYSCRFRDQKTLLCSEHLSIVSAYSPACEKHQWVVQANEKNNILFGSERPMLERVGHIESFLIELYGYDPNHGDPWKHGQDCQKINLNPSFLKFDCE